MMMTKGGPVMTAMPPYPIPDAVPTLFAKIVVECIRLRIFFFWSQVAIACLMARLESYGFYLPTEGVGTEWLSEDEFPDVAGT